MFDFTTVSAAVITFVTSAMDLIDPTTLFGGLVTVSLAGGGDGVANSAYSHVNSLGLFLSGAVAWGGFWRVGIALLEGSQCLTLQQF